MDHQKLLSKLFQELLPIRRGHVPGNRETARDILECPDCGRVFMRLRHIRGRDPVCPGCGWDQNFIFHTHAELGENDLQAVQDVRGVRGKGALMAAVKDEYGVELDDIKSTASAVKGNHAEAVRVLEKDGKRATITERLTLKGLTEKVIVSMSDGTEKEFADYYDAELEAVDFLKGP